MHITAEMLFLIWLKAFKMFHVKLLLNLTDSGREIGVSQTEH